MPKARKQTQKPLPAPDTGPGLRWQWTFLALAVGALALYWPSLGNGLTNWDDPDYVTNNPFAALGPSGFITAFTQPFDGTWYPLTHAIYVLLRLGHASVAASHFVQVLLFAVAVGAVPFALAPFRVARPVGVLSAVLWAVHPLRVESVAWLANVKDTLGLALLLVSFALFGAGRGRLSLAAFVGAILSKSAFFGLGLLFPIVELLSGRSSRAALARTWPWLIASSLGGIVAGVLHLTNPARPPWMDLSARVATALWTPWWYLGRVVFPLHPRAIYDFDPVQFPDGRLWTALGLWLGLAFAAWRWRGLAVVAVAALAALAPVAGFIPLRFLVADRYTLVPSLAVLAGFLAWLGPRVPRLGLRVGVAVLAVPCVVASLGYQHAWRDSVSLWEHTVTLTPGHPTVRMNLANAYAMAERWTDARAQTVALLERKGPEPAILSQLYWLSGAVDRVPPPELEARRDRLSRSLFDAEVVLDEADWCLSQDFRASADALLTWPLSVRDAPRALRMRAALALRQRRPLEAVDLATRAIARGEISATVELVYALADAERAAEALREAERPMPDALSAALLRGAKAYALERLGRIDEARAEGAAAVEAVRALGVTP